MKEENAYMITFSDSYILAAQPMDDHPQTKFYRFVWGSFGTAGRKPRHEFLSTVS
jgi:hypothetical protein